VTNQIYNYALIKALYDEGEDYLDSFWPFVIMTIPAKTPTNTYQPSIDVTQIQKKIETAYSLEMPLHVLSVLLLRAEGKKYIERANPSKYFLSDTGFSYVKTLENDKTVERRITSLLESIKKFFGEKGITLNVQEVQGLLTHFIQVNLDYLINCINPKVTPINPPIVDGNEKFLLEYFSLVDKQEPVNYEIIENMVYGSIISSLLYFEDPQEIKNMETQKFSNCRVYIDSNFLFSFLGMHMDEFTEPAEELLKILKANGFEIRIFSFTIDEVTLVLSAFNDESHKYPIGLRVESIYSALKRKNWTKTDVREFIINIEHTLQQNGILIDWVKDVNLRNYQVSEGLRAKISQYKPEQMRISQNHDLAAIEKIKEIRQNPVRKIEDAKALFLTSDGRLSKYNFENDHKDFGTICEVIVDRLLTNIIWLKNPKTKIPLKSIIAVHSHDLFVNRRVWDRFFNVLQDLKKTGKVTNNGLATLFLHNYLEDSLKSIEEIDAEKISEKFVIDEIEKIRLKNEELEEKKEEEYRNKSSHYEEKIKELEANSKEKEAEFIKNLESVTLAKSKAEQAEKEWAAKVQDIKTNIRAKSEVITNFRINVLRFSFVIIFISIILVSIYLNIPIQYLALAISATGIGGIAGIWAFISKKRNWLLTRIYEKKLKEAKLDEI
jgi:hypothetical protein